ncbi:MAG: hypothetical protein QXV83_01175 [Candidatus Anstonellaceae archaeon]
MSKTTFLFTFLFFLLTGLSFSACYYDENAKVCAGSCEKENYRCEIIFPLTAAKPICDCVCSLKEEDCKKQGKILDLKECECKDYSKIILNCSQPKTEITIDVPIGMPMPTIVCKDDCKQVYGENYFCLVENCTCVPKNITYYPTCSGQSKSTEVCYDDCKQVYGENYYCDKESCSCKCRELTCVPPFVFNKERCECVCPDELKENCPPEYWNENTCTCGAKYCYESEKEQEKQKPLNPLDSFFEFLERLFREIFGPILDTPKIPSNPSIGLEISPINNTQISRSKICIPECKDPNLVCDVETCTCVPKNITYYPTCSGQSKSTEVCYDDCKQVYGENYFCLVENCTCVTKEMLGINCGWKTGPTGSRVCEGNCLPGLYCVVFNDNCICMAQKLILTVSPSTIKVGQTYSIAVSAPVLAPPITSALVLSAGTSKKVVPLTSGQKIDIQFKCIMPGEQKISASWNGFSDSITISCVR